MSFNFFFSSIIYLYFLNYELFAHNICPYCFDSIFYFVIWFERCVCLMHSWVEILYIFLYIKNSNSLPHMPIFISHVKYLFLSFPCGLWFPNKDLPHSNYSNIYLYFCLACLWLHFSYLSFIFLMLFWMRLKDPLYNFGCL